MAQENINTDDIFKTDVKHAVQTLRQGGIILYPTDTVWGLGCDATNQEAVELIYKLKCRAESKSMLVLMADEAMVERYIEAPENIAFELMKETVEPLTVILDNATGIAQNLVAKDGSVGIRIPQERFCQTLLKTFRKPIVSTSANISGEPTATLFSEISQQVIDGADYVARYRRDDTTRRKPSSVIKISKGGVFKIIRK